MSSPSPANCSVMLLHEICGKNPVHPKTMMCIACHGPVFEDECIRFPLTQEWIEQHPQAAEFVISQNAEVCQPEGAKKP